MVLHAIQGGNDGSAPPSDEALMLLSSGGDQRAFAQLAGRYHARVVRFCSLLCRKKIQAEDVAQDVFLRLWKSRHRYASDGRFEAFLFTIARNACRSANRRSRLEAFFVPERPDDVAADDGERKQLHGITRAALEKLPFAQKEALVLRFIEELAYADIAQALDLNESTARSRVHYGLAALAAILPDEVKP